MTRDLNFYTADVQSRSWGGNLKEAISQCALSLIATISPDLNKIDRKVEKTIKIEAEDKEALIFDFLSELLYIFDVEGLIFSEIQVNSLEETSDTYRITVTLKGEKFNREKHSIGTEVKAITYSFMEIKEKENKVEIKIVFDI